MSSETTGMDEKNMEQPSMASTPQDDEVKATSVEETSAPIMDVAEVVASIEETPAPTMDLGDEAPSAGDEPHHEEEVQHPPAPDAPPSRFKRGDLAEGVITSSTPTAVTVDFGEGAIGVIPGRELERMTRQSLEELTEGKKITVYVVNPHSHEGTIILSVNRAIEELDWQRAETFHKSQDPYEANVAGYNKGGLIVRFGRLRGFIPQSQISDDRKRLLENGEGTVEDRYAKMVNEPIVVKVMEVDRSRNRLILSERTAARERRERRKESLIEELTVGQIIANGRVVSLEDFGAFVDVGGAEGLVHLTEISWKHVTHPKEALKIGQTVKVEVISVDRERRRIGLSIKRQEADPWDDVATTYQVGDLVKATVTKMTKFGAFARLVDAEDIEGLIHISELSDKRVMHPKEVVKEGEQLDLRVVKIDVKNRRLGLSLKRVNSPEWLDRDLQRYMSGQ
ncbi:MAG: S1 RNA-binding domain-containing protein [Anaerolineae bacterium]|nr:S1 RNA-binding domain-containing protein [Anaerolineae bacterium]